MFILYFITLFGCSYNVLCSMIEWMWVFTWYLQCLYILMLILVFIMSMAIMTLVFNFETQIDRDAGRLVEPWIWHQVERISSDMKIKNLQHFLIYHYFWNFRTLLLYSANCFSFYFYVSWYWYLIFITNSGEV